MNIYRNFIVSSIIVGTFFLTGCNGIGLSNGAMGGIGGAGIGALAGQAIGGNTKSTLIGTAIGGVGGYIIGNEQDKYEENQRMQQLEYENYRLRQNDIYVRPYSPCTGSCLHCCPRR